MGMTMYDRREAKNKNVTICFRTTDDLRGALEKISAEQRRSVSSTIEMILYDHVAQREDMRQTQSEKRRYPRKPVAVPALVTDADAQQKQVHAGIVLDISLGGLKISIPDTYQFEVEEDKENARISIVFTLPDSKRPLAVKCVPEHVYRTDGDTMIGASFADTDFASYQALQNYLIN
jgi:hypothetical protein